MWFRWGDGDALSEQVLLEALGFCKGFWLLWCGGVHGGDRIELTAS